MSAKCQCDPGESLEQQCGTLHPCYINIYFGSLTLITCLGCLLTSAGDRRGCWIGLSKWVVFKFKMYDSAPKLSLEDFSTCNQLPSVT